MESSRNVDLPEELTHEILLRLPVKALLRFKCVCKAWCALIKSRSFIDGHYDHESNPGGLLIHRRSSHTGSEFSIHTDDDGKHLRSDYLSQMPTTRGNIYDLLGPANGVFCAVRRHHGSVALFNPATKKLKPLPPVPLPDLGYVEFGFGFDHFTGDFKVVAFERVHKSERFFCVYSSSTDSWRKRKIVDWMNNRFHAINCGYHDLLLNGVFHWLDQNVFNLRDKSILGFDTRSENFREIIVPDGVREERIHVHLTAYGDSLALLALKGEIDVCPNLWVKGRDGPWTKCCSITLPQPYMIPLCMWDKNEMFLRTCEKYAQIKNVSLFLFDVSTLKLRKIGPGFDIANICKFFSYKESLVSIEGETYVADDCVQDFFKKFVG